MEIKQDRRAAHLNAIYESLPEEYKDALLTETERVCGSDYARVAEFRREWLLAYERLKAEMN